MESQRNPNDIDLPDEIKRQNSITPENICDIFVQQFLENLDDTLDSEKTEKSGNQTLNY